MKKLILLSLLLVSCTQARSNESIPFPRSDIGDGVSRFETSDAICYTYYQHAISCLPKDKK